MRNKCGSRKGICRFVDEDSENLADGNKKSSKNLFYRFGDKGDEFQNLFDKSALQL